MFLMRIKLINLFFFYNCNPHDFFELQIKELLEHVEETWKVIHEGPENKILLYYAEENKIFIKRYSSELLSFYKNKKFVSQP